jgi:hypothetical protein
MYPFVETDVCQTCEVERLQRALDQRNEQIDGYERQLGIDSAGAERTIGSEIERLLAASRVETSRKPDGYLVQYGDRVSAYAGSLDSLIFQNLKEDGIEYMVTPLYAGPAPETPAPPEPGLKTCDHPESELLAEKQVAGEPLFQMRKCLDCNQIFRVRSSLKSATEPGT